MNSRLLFYGELPNDTLHGISISNQINLQMLGSSFQIDIIQEKNKLSEHSRLSFNKLTGIIKNLYIILNKTIVNKYNFFYLIFSLSTVGSLKALSAVLVFRIFNRGKVVLHLHRGDFFTRFYKYRINRILTSLIFGLSYRIIVLSEKQRLEFESAFGRPFYVLSNTVEMEYETERLKNQKSRFVYISNYIKEKGIMDLLNVFKKLAEQYPEITLRTFGAFSDKNLERSVLQFNSQNISINGTISGKEKYDELASSDCLLLPSWNEGQPLVLLEAMSVGTPVISSRVGLIPELLGNDYPYFSEAGNINSLEDNIVNFINEANADQISNDLKKRFNASFSHQVHASRLNAIFSIDN